VLSTLQIQENYRAVQQRVHAACERVGRTSDDVLLLPVSKLHSAEAIAALYELGVRDFGESRVQELLKKKEQLPQDIRWHFIGNLQSNKARQITDFVHLVHSVYTLGLAEELAKRATRPIDVLLEIKISGEATKGGIHPDDAETLVDSISRTCPNIRVTGLMGMASFEEDPERTRPQFRTLRKLRDELCGRYPDLRELSMGMTNDYEVAIEEGATIVRVGSAIFGER
jgi:pyridoxal phosphate enzyme (YggS family)